MMEFTLEEIADLINGPLNDEDLYAICEKMCLAVLALDQNQCRKIMITRDSVFLGPEGNIKIDIDLYRQKITKENLMANHIYAIGTVLLWLAKSKSPNRDRDQMLENLMAEMMNTSPTDRPTLEIVSQACEMILQRYQVSSKDILNVMYDDCVRNPSASALVEKRKRRRLKGPLIKPRTKSPYQLVSIEDKGGELRDGSLIEEQIEVETETREMTETEQGRVDPDESVSSHDTHDILDETDLDSNPPTEGTWDYDHMDVSVTTEAEEDLSQKTQETADISQEHSNPSTILSKQTSEDREVAKFTGQNGDLLNAPPILSDSTSESGESTSKYPGEEEEEPPTNRFRSLSNDQLSNDGMAELTTAPVIPVAVSPVLVKPVVEPVIEPKEEVIESKEDEDKEKDEQDTTVAATFIKKPSKPKPKASDLWRKAGMNIKSKLNLPSNKGLLGVVKQAEAQGQLKPKMFNRNITKAISAMAKKQAAKDQVKIEKPSDQDGNKISAEEIEQKTSDLTAYDTKQQQDIKPAEMDTKKTENKAEKTEKEEADTKPVPPKLFPKPQKATVQPVLKKSESTDSKSKSSQPDKPKNSKKVPVTRPRSASVTAKQSKTSPAVKDTKPRRQSVAGTIGVTKDKKTPSKTADKKPPSKTAEKPKSTTKPKPPGSTKIQKTITPKEKPPLTKSATVTGNKTPTVQRKASAPSPSVTRKSSTASPAVKRKVSAPSPTTQRKTSTSKPASTVSKPAPPIQRKASLTKPMAKPKMKTIPENKVSAAARRKVSLPSPPSTAKPGTPATRRKSTSSIDTKPGKTDKKPSAAKKPQKKNSKEKLPEEYKPVMVPRKDLVVDKDDPGFKRSERILSIGSPKQETPDVSPVSTDSVEPKDWEQIKDTQNVPPSEESEVITAQQTPQEGGNVKVAENSPSADEPHPEPLPKPPEQETPQIIPEPPTPEQPCKLLEPPEEETITGPQTPEKEADKISDGEEQADQIVILKPVPQKKGIADLNNLNSSFEIAVQLDPPESDEIFPENDPEDSIELELTSPEKTPLEIPLETSVEIEGGLETILETSKENETGDTSTDLDLEPQKEILSDSDEVTEKARQDQMKRLLDDPEIKPVDLPEVSITETGKQNRSPSSRYKRMKSIGRKPVATEPVKTESNFTFQPIQPDKSNQAEEETDHNTPEPVHIPQPDPVREPVHIPQPDPIRDDRETAGSEQPQENNEVDENQMLEEGTTVTRVVPTEETKSPQTQPVSQVEDEIEDEVRVSELVPVETKPANEDEPGEKDTEVEVEETTERETAFNFKPISPAVNQAADLADENEDSFFPKLEVQQNPVYRSPSPVAIMRDLVKPLNFSTETVNLEDLMKVLDRPLGENELWLLLLGTAKSLQSTAGFPALNPTMISIDSNGLVHTPAAEGKQKLDNSETDNKLEEQGAVFSVGACLWYCADYGLSEAEEPVLSRTLQNLLVNMTQAAVEERPTLLQLVQEYKKHMGQDEKTLKTLYSQYRSQLRNMSASVVPQQQYLAPTPSIQIIINKDDMTNRSLRVDPSITINERTSDDLNRSRVVQLPVRDKRDNTDNSLRGQTPNAGVEPVSFADRGMVASTPNPVQEKHEEGLEERQFIDFLSVDDPEVSPPVQMMKSSVQRRRLTGGIESRIPEEPSSESTRDVMMFNIPDIQFTEATLSFSKDNESFKLEEPKVSNENFFKPSDYVHISEKQKEERAEKQTSDGEFEPDNQAFLDLEEGMSSLRSQVSRLLEQDNSHLFSTPVRSRTLSHDVCSTPMTSSPLNSTIDDLDDFSISPIKETTFEDGSNILDWVEIERPVQKQLVRRASIAETLTQFQSEGRIPPESCGALEDIMSLLDLEVDINDVLEYLEKRIEVNIDRLEMGDNVVNALAGIESDIEFKLLQVEAMRKVTKRDDDELSKIHCDSEEGTNEPEVRISDFSGSKDSEGIEEELLAHLAPSRESLGAEGGLEGLNVQILEHLREISKSPLHFDEDEVKGDVDTPGEVQSGSQYNLMQNIIDKHAPLLSPRSDAVSSDAPPQKIAGRAQTIDHHQAPRLPFRPMEDSKSKSASKSQKVSIPKDQLMMFFQRHLPEQDSRDVMESLGGNVLDISDEEDSEQTHAITNADPKTVSGATEYGGKVLSAIEETEEVPTHSKMGRRQLSMCSVEEHLNLSGDETSDNEGSVTTSRVKTEISSAYGRTSPDGAYSSDSETDTNYPTFDIGPVVLKPTKRQKSRETAGGQGATPHSSKSPHPNQVETPAPPQYFDKTAEQSPFLSSYQLPSLM